MSELSIKAFFGNWFPCSKEYAIEFATTMIRHCNMPKDEAIKVFNEKHIRGYELKREDIENDNC